MEILVYMDEEDKEAWHIVAELYNDAVKQIRATHEPTIQTDLKQKTAEFWHNRIEKYGVLRNKQLTVDVKNGTICCWTSPVELRR